MDKTREGLKGQKIHSLIQRKSPTREAITLQIDCFNDASAHIPLWRDGLLIGEIGYASKIIMG